jgi:two-component system chemotaxis response regulator CheB
LSIIRVLVVEDSLSQRHRLVSLIREAAEMVVVGQAFDGLQALEMVEKLHPDVISMDLRMPRLNGVEATRLIMDQFPTPIVVVSSASSDSEITMQAMQAGALAAIEKPPADDHPDFTRRRDELVSMLRLMSEVRVIRHWTPSIPVSSFKLHGRGTAIGLGGTGPLSTPVIRCNDAAPAEIVVIGTSAGGPSALVEVLSRLPATFNLPIVIVQHLTAEFMPGLADWLNRSCPLPVRLARRGELPTPGTVLLAPGGAHLAISRDRRIVLDSSANGHRHQPAVDVLLESVAAEYGPNAVGVILTGMGDDGAVGLRAMRNAGARTIVQNEETCIVFGMPAASIALGAAEFVLPLDKIGSTIITLSDCAG